MQRIGVFVCWCGSNIAGTVDVQAVSEALKNEPGVVFSANYQYMCSQAGQNMIIEAVKDVTDVYIPTDKHFEEALKTQPEPKFYSGDGVHPNANGSAFIGKLYADAVEELLK